MITFIDFILFGIIIIAFIFELSFIIFIIFYVIRKTKERNNIYKTILRKNKFLSKGLWFPVKYCSYRRYKKFWKLFPYEAAGILFLTKNNVIFYGETWSNKKIKLIFNNKIFDMFWVGRDYHLSSSSWFVIKIKNEKHFLSAECGITIIGSKKKTINVYNELIKLRPRQHRITRGYAVRKQSLLSPN